MADTNTTSQASQPRRSDPNANNTPPRAPKIEKSFGLHALKFKWPWLRSSRPRQKTLPPREDFEKHCIPAVQSAFSKTTKFTHILDSRAAYCMQLADEFVVKVYEPDFKSFIYNVDEDKKHAVYAQTVARAAQTAVKAAALVADVHLTLFMYTLETTRLFPEDDAHDVHTTHHNSINIQKTVSSTLSRSPQEMHQSVVDCLAALAVTIDALHHVWLSASVFLTFGSVLSDMGEAIKQLVDPLKKTLAMLDSDNILDEVKSYEIDWVDTNTIKSSARLAMVTISGQWHVYRSVSLSEDCLNCAEKIVEYVRRSKRIGNDSIEEFIKLSLVLTRSTKERHEIFVANDMAEARLLSFMALSGDGLSPMC